MSNLWERLGFRGNPYDSRPLRPVRDDVDLFVGRISEAVRFYTSLDTSEQGVFVLAGSPGVGKTSFLNVHQYLLETGLADFGPPLLLSHDLCSVASDDSPKDVALKALGSVIRSLEVHCGQYGWDLPEQVDNIRKWVGSRHQGGMQLGITILGVGATYGRNTSLPPVSSATFDNLYDALLCVVGEVVKSFERPGILIAIDNLDTLKEKKLIQMLHDFRDTLFAVPRAWWVLIGPSGLPGLIQSGGGRLAERIGSNRLELMPLSYEEFEEAIRRRVKLLSERSSAQSPLPADIHKILYDSSFGEIRFVFDLCTRICAKYFEIIRAAAAQRYPDSSEQMLSQITAVVAQGLSGGQISTKKAMDLLREEVLEKMAELNLSPDEREILENAKLTEGQISLVADLSGSSERINAVLGDLSRRRLVKKFERDGSAEYQLSGIGELYRRFSSFDTEIS